MKKIEIKLNELPKYKYDSIINNIKKEFTYEEETNDLTITLYIDKQYGIKADITNQYGITKRDKDNELTNILIHFIDTHLVYQYGGVIDVKILYNNYKEWCIANNLNYYQSINSFYTDKFKKILADRGMNCNKKAIFNALYGFVPRM